MGNWFACCQNSNVDKQYEIYALPVGEPPNPSEAPAHSGNHSAAIPNSRNANVEGD